MSEKQYIEREDITQAKPEFLNPEVKGPYADGWNNCISAWLNEINALPAAPVREVVRGRWIADAETGEPVCSICHSGKPKTCACSSLIDHKLKNHEIRYCYYCGADMRAEEGVTT